MSVDIDRLMSFRAARTATMQTLKPPTEPPEFDFYQGIPAPETFPLEVMKKISAEVIDEFGTRNFEYRDPTQKGCGFSEMTLGATGLRGQIAAFLKERDGAELTEDEVILSFGSVHAIDMTMDAFVEPGDAVVLETPTFPWAVRAAQNAGGTVHSVPIGATGIDIAQLDAVLTRCAKDGVPAKVLYLGVDFQSPTGTVLPLDDRLQLLEVADRHDIVVVEDAVYRDLRYDGEPVPSLLSLDQAGRVVQIGSFSKILFPGVRVGWAAGRADLIGAVGNARNDLGNSQWTARMMEKWLADGHHRKHLARVIDLYRRRRDLADELLRTHCAEFVDYQKPPGAYYFWLRLADTVDWDAASVQMRDRGVYMRPGEAIGNDPRFGRYMRMAFAHVSEDVLVRGIEALGVALRAAAV